MLLCQLNPQLQLDTVSLEDFDWTNSAQNYPNLEESIPKHRESSLQCPFNTAADPHQLQGKQLQAYTIVHEHHAA